MATVKRKERPDPSKPPPDAGMPLVDVGEPLFDQTPRPRVRILGTDKYGRKLTGISFPLGPRDD